jgi:predicted nucleic acid-binding Zn ribbon protein
VKKAGELLAAFFDRQTFNAAKEYSDLFSSWQSIAGETLAAHSRIRELEHSVLLVEADHPGWIQILQTKEKNLLDALRRRFPDRHITGISFRLSRDPPPLNNPSQPVPDESAGEAGRELPGP